MTSDVRLSDDQFLQWGNSAQPPQSYENNVPYAANNSLQPPQSSNQMVRRPMNQLTRHAAGQWPEQSDATSTDTAWSDDIQELERKAQIAKKEAQTKRKQIPPFVQKLNSFLENGKNTDLIRWSDDGNSFIVLDEDEFAKTLIPELFKHNNYASFVRQLNMYGFHKKVGLSDNSMRASERKNKSPSEYSNPYFRRGHPELLWLIQKPKNANTKKTKKADAEQVDEDVDDFLEDVQQPTGVVRPRPQLTLELDDESSLSSEQLQSIQRELQTIKQQQAQIQRMMRNLKHDQDNLYGQATSFQDQHSRHENSINAILTFLATVYNRSLQGHEGMQGIQSLFSGAIPHENASGTVVDVGDYTFENPVGPDVSPNKSFKRPLLITDGSQQGRASTMSPSTANSPFTGRNTQRTSQQYRTSTTPQPAVEEVFDSAEPTPLPNQHDIMNVINNTNARNGASPGTGNPPDFSHMISSLENSGGANPLNPSQRADMLRLINNSAGNSGRGGDNALINATPPPGPTNFDRQLQNSRANYDHLAKMQAEQDKNVQNLTSLLQPLSPSGSIPGIHDNTNLPPAPWDVDDFLSAGHDYFNDFPTDANFDLNTAGADAPATGTMGFNDYDDMFGAVPDAPDSNAANGRVESASVASSEVLTPETDDDSLARKGRKLSFNESDGRRKKVRRG